MNTVLPLYQPKFYFNKAQSWCPNQTHIYIVYHSLRDYFIFTQRGLFVSFCAVHLWRRNLISCIDGHLCSDTLNCCWSQTAPHLGKIACQSDMEVHLILHCTSAFLFSEAQSAIARLFKQTKKASKIKIFVESALQVKDIFFNIALFIFIHCKTESKYLHEWRSLYTTLNSYQMLNACWYDFFIILNYYNFLVSFVIEAFWRAISRHSYSSLWCCLHVWRHIGVS